MLCTAGEGKYPTFDSYSYPRTISLGEGTATYKSLSVGEQHGCAIGSDDGLYCWGGGDQVADLGNASTSNSVNPVQVSLGDSPGTFKYVVLGGSHSCALGTDDNYYCWG